MFAYINRADVYRATKEYDRAIADYDQVVRLDPGNASGFAATAWSMKGGLHQSKGDLDRAIEDYDEAIRLDPHRVLFHIERASLWSRKGNGDRTLVDYDQALKLDPNDAAAYNARADFYRAKSQYARAIEDYNQSIHRHPDYLPAYGNRALSRLYLGEFGKAAEDFKRVADEQANGHALLLGYISRARAGRREAREAKDELAKGAGRLKASEWPYPLVELYLGRNSAEAAVAAAGKPEERCEAQFYIGEWHLVRGDHAPAAKALQAAADTCPKDFVEYRGAVEDLKRLKER